MKTIVLAKTEMTGRRETGNFERFNGNYYPEFIAVPVVKACVWLNEGTEEDEAFAAKYARKEGFSVLTFPTSEKDPLGKAKKALLP